MKLFYHPQLEGLEEFIVEDEEAKHLRVLRVGEVDDIYFTDGKGNKALCRVIMDKNKTVVKVVEIDMHEPSNPQLTILIAPTKNTDRMEWFVEKAVELGIHQIIFSITANSERPYMKIERMKRVAIAAMKQSLKFYLPEIIISGQFLKHDQFDFTGIKLLAHCNSYFDRAFIYDTIKSGDDVLIAIGPEGDFNKDEIELALKQGYLGITMGESRLRTETAALYSVMSFNLKNHSPTI